ncbi:MAG TPA: haloacid dehalogenase-like hydrolase [Candidatus Angelobacter sp.]
MKIRASGSQKLSAAALHFVETVVALQPRIAVFDCDGTLWEGDSGADFFYWQIERGLVPKDVAQWALRRYQDYKAGKVDEETICGEMVSMNAGIPETLLEEAGEEFFASVVEPRIFQEMQELTQRLIRNGSQLWAVSSTNFWSICAGVRRFGISCERVLAVTVEIENGLATDRLIQVPTDEGKAVAIRKSIPEPVDVCMGNSIHDAAMLELARHPFAVGPTQELITIASEKAWNVYWPGKNQ